MRRSDNSAKVCAFFALSLMGLGGCSTLPDSGPSAKDVTSQETSAEQGPRYIVVDIDGAAIDALKA